MTAIREEARAEAAGNVSLADKVAFLSAMTGVERVVETHMAFVFLTRTDAFKLKKPVRFGYFDHRTIGGRHRACAAELRLNRELAGNVYLGLIPLVRGKTGALSLGGRGRTIDWLVDIKRLPAEQMLDTLISTGRGPSSAAVKAIIDRLADFYRQHQRRRPPRGMYLAHLMREQTANAAHLAEMANLVPGISLDPLLREMGDRLAAAGTEIAAREEAGLILEGHGDLRPEHVCLIDPPVIFDRIETAREMRVIDVFDELGYLGVECALLGRPDIRAVLLSLLAEAGFAPPSATLQTTYAMFRLLTRARLSLDHLRDPVPATPEKWPVRARLYLAEAVRLSAHPGAPSVPG